jgi:pyruvate dehydrogenase E2 component (dihydrolipoamide acetyltransferase)
MPFEITMPQLGLTMEKGTVVQWLVKEGDAITPGQEILQVETDKAVVGVEARQEGTIAQILIPTGREVPVGTVLAIGVKAGEALPAAQPSAVSASEPSPALAAVPTGDGRRQASWKARVTARHAGLSLEGIVGSGPAGRILAQDVAGALTAPEPHPAVVAPNEPETRRATPIAARLAEALGLDLATIAGSGPTSGRGRIGQDDVLAAAAAIIRGAAAPPPAQAGLPQVARAVPLAGVRRIVSEGMAASAHTTARVTLFREVDTSALAALRERSEKQGMRLSYNDLLIRIAAVALREHPEANARLGDGQIEVLDRVNVGLAVDTDRGLLVPVIHDADRLTLAQIAAETARLVAAARSGRIPPDDLGGGTFTLTNLGMFGVEGFTPVINLPECCILGVGQIVRKPVVVDEADTVTVRPTMTLSLVFDHRVIDGAPAARFLERIAQLVEEPALLIVAG